MTLSRNGFGISEATLHNNVVQHICTNIAGEGRPGGMQTIQFPENRCLGYVHTNDAGQSLSFHGRHSLEGELFADINNPDWELCGEARGEIELPDGSQVMLEVLPQAARDLLPLSNLRPDDLDGLWLGNTWADDDQLQFVAGLTGLQWIDLQNNGRITDTGVGHLHRLTALKSFGAHWTRISSETMRWLATLPEIQYVDIWGCEIPPQDIEALRQARPNCHVRVD